MRIGLLKGKNKERLRYIFNIDNAFKPELPCFFMKKLLAMAALALAAGCASLPARAESFLPKSLSLRGRIAYAPRYNQLSLNESREVPVHPADAGFISGSTWVRAGNGWEAFAIRPGVELAKDLGRLELTAGVDLELNFDSVLVEPKDGPTMSDYRQQQGDTRPEGSGSFAMDYLQRDFFGVQPFVGLSFKTDTTRFFVNGFIPIQKATRSWGHHRYDSFEEVGSEKYNLKGFGVRAGFIGLDTSKNDSSLGTNVGLEASYETYSLDSGNSNTGEAGTLNSFSLGVICNF